MEKFNYCSYYLHEKKEYKCISCGKILDKKKNYTRTLCKNVDY